MRRLWTEPGYFPARARPKPGMQAFPAGNALIVRAQRHSMKAAVSPSVENFPVRSTF